MGAATAVRPPRQARTRATWQRILDVGLEILEQDGYAGLTIPALCARAGVTPPTIYARAPSKEILLLAIYDHAIERITRVDTLDPDDARWRTFESTEQVIAEAVRVVAGIWLRNARLLRALVYRSGVDAETFARGSQHSIDLGRRFRALLLARPELAGSAQAAERIDVCFRMVYAALVQRVMFGEGFESDLPLADEALQRALVEVVSGYLIGEVGR